MEISLWITALLIFVVAVILRINLATWLEKSFGRRTPATVTIPYLAVFLCVMAIGSQLVVTAAENITVVTFALLGSMASLSELVAIAVAGTKTVSKPSGDA